MTPRPPYQDEVDKDTSQRTRQQVDIESSEQLTLEMKHTPGILQTPPANGSFTETKHTGGSHPGVELSTQPSQMNNAADHMVNIAHSGKPCTGEDLLPLTAHGSSYDTHHLSPYTSRGHQPPQANTQDSCRDKLDDGLAGLSPVPDAMHQHAQCDMPTLQNTPIYMREIYDTVSDSGLYNFQKTRARIPSGLNIENWRRYLEGYSDPNLADYLEYGWPINCDRRSPLVPTERNHFSAEAYPDHIDYYIETELRHAALLGPFAGPPVFPTHINPLMTTEKKDSEHRRVILDLSFPPGASVNDGISQVDYIDGPLTVRLPTVNSLERRILDLGKGAYLYKTDLARGYRQLRVDPSDWGLIAFRHRGAYYLDICPPFGLRSSAMMMVRTTSAITQLHLKRGFVSIAYIDDFGGAEGGKDRAEDALANLQDLFRELGMEEAPAKVCPPSQVMTWLGIQFDTVKMNMSIPPKKLEEIAETLRAWQGKARANLKEIQSIFGLLQFVTSVAPSARLFTNRILEAMREMTPDRYTTLSWGFKRDLKFFQDLLPNFKGVKIIDKSDLPAQHSLELDACLSGCGAICGTKYYGREFPEFVISLEHPIAHLELLNIVVAVKLWADSWGGHRVRIDCDNMNSVLALQTGRARDPFMQHCAREIYLYCARFDIDLLVSHAPGAAMQRADALSREHLSARYRAMVDEDRALKSATRVNPDDRLFILMNEL